MKTWVDLWIVIFLGPFGVHKFKEGNTKMGFLYLFTAGLFGIGWFVDIIKTAKEVSSGTATSSQSNIAPESRKHVIIAIVILFTLIAGIRGLIVAIIGSIIYYMYSEKQMGESQRREEIRSRVQESKLPIIKVKDIILKTDEIGHLREKIKVTNKNNDLLPAVLYITNKRIIINVDGSFDDWKLSDIIYMNVKNDVLTFSGSKNKAYISSEDADLIEIVFKKAIEETKQIQKGIKSNKIKCDYCGAKNDKSNSNCYNCQAPLF